MGDVVSLVERAQEQVSEEEAEALQEKMAKGKLTMEDFLSQLKSLRRMGSMKSPLGMLPGIGSQLKDLDIDEKQIDRTEAIIHSMTPEERKDIDLLDTPRRCRISRGSGTQPQEVSQLVKGFHMVSQMSRQISGMGMMSRLKSMAGIGQQDLAAMMASGKTPHLPTAPQSNKPKFNPRKKKSR